MKAIINGNQVEGTPQEIAEYERIINGQIRSKPYKFPIPSDTNGYDWLWPYKPEITCCDSYTYTGPVVTSMNDTNGGERIYGETIKR